jgi:predicted CXXCH cytochrome family protein
MPIVWAFGSGSKAYTPVLRVGGDWVEHRLSWYSAGGRLGLTPGHAAVLAPNVEAALGLVQSKETADRCFGCHTTNGEPGVTCQRCHGDGAAHRAQPAKSNIRRVRSIALCAECHRSPVREYVSPAPEIEDPLSIRFAPVGFQASRCAQSSPSFTCVSCHNPHENARPARDRAYTQVCRSCHSGSPKQACPRTAGCPACHMPVSSPVPNLTFTDHRIR